MKCKKPLVPALAIIMIILISGRVWPQFMAPQDIEITNEVRNGFLSDKTVPEGIEIKTNAGVVTLTGKVDNILAKERAERIAENVTGVILVNNRIEVSIPEKTSDDKIRENIISALEANPATDAYKTNVRVSEGIVTLDGNVNSFQERNLAESLTKSVKGVRAVINEIGVVYTESRPDTEIARDIREALQWDTLVNSDHIRVNVLNGKVTLVGTIATAAEKRRAIEKALVPGVRSVDATTLEVARLESQEKRKGDINITDDGIRKAIEKHLMLDPLVDRLKVKIDVSDEVVSLRGKVESLQARRSAGDAARTVMGVIRVNNLLEVDPPGEFTDEQIKTAAELALIRDPYVSSYEISVDVNKGVVTLSGIVDTPAEKDMADSLISGAKGVTGIKNLLKVEYPAGGIR